MDTKKVGSWYVAVGCEDMGREVHGEDGPFWLSRLMWLVSASSERGAIYMSLDTFATEAEAVAFAEGLPETFDAATHEGFEFSRTAYGSPDWSTEDEYAMMDDEEREHFFRR